jgi:hypothetical protein
MSPITPSPSPVLFGDTWAKQLPGRPEQWWCGGVATLQRSPPVAHILLRSARTHYPLRTALQLVGNWTNRRPMSFLFCEQI